ncbi:MAG: DciA family protein [Gammaproteobacteria bacterium]|nr:DciA family protein [Gammaproteobacteria bacterium]MDP6615574.1 DciA family protein [Gammaproteobacteria bacterium]MDP6694752.1 DciA family protein [Gammaproteobacteria bacterium]MDP7041625.1 DciA family protein [Gammaproteobacteria bacterium]
MSELIRTADSPLRNLAEEARRRSDLGDYLRRSLPPEVSRGLVHCNFQPDNTLILLASSPEWAARLRFEAERVRELCRKNGTPVEHVKVRVAAV